jgi:hypothetical protein
VDDGGKKVSGKQVSEAEQHKAFEQRMNDICAALRHCKLLCRDLTEWRGNWKATVHAPKLSAKEKAKTFNGNNSRPKKNVANEVAEAARTAGPPEQGDTFAGFHGEGAEQLEDSTVGGA